MKKGDIRFWYCDNALPSSMFHSVRGRLLGLEHHLSDINYLGPRWHVAVPKDVIDVLSPVLLGMLAQRGWYSAEALKHFSPRYWDSVIRGPGQPLETHNDVLPIEEDRRVAVLLYMNHLQGGELVLHEREGDCSIKPRPNRLVFLSISETSHHSVCDVLKGQHRHALVGWYNGPAGVGFYDYVPSPLHEENTVIRRLIKSSWVPGLDFKGEPPCARKL